MTGTDFHPRDGALPPGSSPAPSPSRRTAWVQLLAASVFEVLFAATLKASNGFSVLAPSVATVVCLTAAVLLMTLALKVLDAAVGYTIWTGAGTVGSVVLGAVIFDELISAAELCFLLLIIAGVIGLRTASSESD